MQQKLILLIISILFGYESAVFAQTTRCDLLKTVLSNSKVNITFNLDHFKDKPIVIVDTNYHFKNCLIDSVYGRRVFVVHTPSFANDKNYSNIVVGALITDGKYGKLELYYKIKQAYGWVEFKSYPKRTKLLKVNLGYF